MRSRLTIFTCIFFILFLSVFVFLNTSEAVPMTWYLDTPSTDVEVGDYIDVYIMTSGWVNEDFPSLTDFDITVTWDRSIMDIDDIDNGGSLSPISSGLSFNSVIDQTDGVTVIGGKRDSWGYTTSDGSPNLQDDQPDTFSAFVLELQAMAEGIVTFSISSIEVEYSNPTEISDGDLLPDREDLLIYVNSVPEPSTMLLLGTGLVGLVGIGRKKYFKKK